MIIYYFSKVPNATIRVLDIHDKFIDPSSNNNCKMSLFEEVIYTKQGTRLDKIHLNSDGLKLLRDLCTDFIVNKRMVNLGKIMPQGSEITEELLNEGNFTQPVKQPLKQALPKVACKVGDYHFDCIVDTGSQATIMSEENFLKLVKESNINIMTLPVTNLTIVGITGVRSKRIHTQALIDFEFERDIMSFCCLIVKEINIPTILGVDFCAHYKVNVDFANQCLYVPHETNPLEIPFKREDTVSSVFTLRVVQSNFVSIFETDSDLEAINDQVMNFYTHKEIDRNENVGLDQSNVDLKEKISEIKRDFPSEELHLLNDFENMLMSNKEVFSNEPGLIKDFKAKFNIKEDVPFTAKSYPIPFSKRKQVQDEINNMLDAGLIEYSDSPYTNPLVCVTKTDNTIRLCMDGRNISKLIIPDRESPPEIVQLFQKFAGVKYFSVIDLTQGYFQIEVAEEFRKYLSFMYNGVNLRWVRLPFGLNVSGAIFIKALNQIIGNDLSQNVSVYVDDILITSSTLEEHIRHIDQVLNRLKQAGATVKLKKSKFLKSEIKFLGHIITKEGIQMDPEKIQDIVNFKRPHSIKSLQKFLGLVNWYRKFQQKHAELTARLNHLLRKNSEWNWTDCEEQIFNQIKEEFLRTIVLHHPDFSKPFYINTDASDIAVSAILQQYDDQGDLRVISFASRTIKPNELLYTITEKELLSVIFACQKFRTFIYGHYSVIIRTDHQALAFLKNCRLTHGRLLRWILVLQEFNLEIQYLKGKDNVPADILSRIHSESYVSPAEKNLIAVYKANLSLGFKDSQIKQILSKLSEKQDSDPKCFSIKQRLINHGENYDKLKVAYLIYNNILFYKAPESNENFKVYIPENILHDFIEYSHLKYGHIGSHKLFLTLRTFCIFPNMERTIKKQVKCCVLCQKAKPMNKTAVGPLQAVLPQRVKELISVDHIGPLPTGRFGVKFMFVLLDVFSKYVKIYPVKRATANTVVNKILNDYIPLVGKIEAVISDNGPAFISSKYIEKMNENGIKVYHSTPYHPASQVVERCNREINKMCRIYCHEQHTSWPNVIEFIENCLNLSVHCTTECIPYELMFGKVCRNFLNSLISFPERTSVSQPDLVKLVRHNMSTKAEKRRLQQEKKVQTIQYKVDDLVLLKTHPLSDKVERKIKKYFLLYTGPYKIIEIINKNAYKLVNPHTGDRVGTYNATQLKKFHSK